MVLWIMTAWQWMEGHYFIWLVAGMVLCSLVMIWANRDE
jgi:hypothetical protein